ncbi:hypothetical protein [Solirubrobacter soli]|uniref:hypothetical protein n=1 Tax=Solirubrobacter soli TaxID=363832 RepID=UPI00041CF480|nr:hypothetical protein [Solirubrobacter soli]
MHLNQRPAIRSERGFSMFIVLMALTVTAMFVAASFAAVNGDLPQSATAKNRKSTYAAAEAGLAFYLNHLQQDPDYWTLCDKAPDPNASERSPINLQWDGAGNDPRTWRTVPGTTAQYTIELLETKNYPNGCVTTDQKSIIDESTGTFKVRFTGRPSPSSSMHRSIVATFRRDSFLNFVYFTEFEDIDPNALSDSTARATALSKCAEKYRTARASTTANGCPYGNEITFPDGDKVNGPLHTNDESLMTCGTPTFGRDKTIGGATMSPKTDTIEVRGPLPGYAGRQSVTQGSRSYTGCSTNPTINTPTGKFTPNAKYLQMPQSNQKLAEVAQSNGTYYTGKTIIRLNNTTMDVTNYAANGTSTTRTGVAWPNNGVLYVDNAGTCSGEYPTDANYDEAAACGNVYVSGTYAKSLTIASRNDIIVKPTIGAKLNNNSTDSDLKGASDATLGLIADNFIRVGHRVATDSSGDCDNYAPTNEPTVLNVRIEAAILSLKHSFIADNYNCGKLGTLTIVGAIAQRYRGTVSTFSGTTIVTGFTKNYWYDDRFRYRSPPYFLSPLDSAWDVVRVHEQVPAR